MIVSLPKLRFFCCGCSLQKGAVIIGVINLVMSVLGMMTCLGVMIASEALAPLIKDYLNEALPGWNEDLDTLDFASGKSVS